VYPVSSGPILFRVAAPGVLNQTSHEAPRCPGRIADAVGEGDPGRDDVGSEVTVESSDVDALSEALAFLDQYELAFDLPLQLARRADVETDLAHRGTYSQTSEELEFGCKAAWRNHTRCVGKLYWRSLEVQDRRDLTTAVQVFEALVEHLRYALNGGRIRPLITVFAPAEPGSPGIRIWNDQLIRYAGYRAEDGSVVGDPANVALTDSARALGWTGADGGRFDVLPLIIQMPGESPSLFELPEDVLVEVPISHPEHHWFADLGLKWYAFPSISNIRLEIGGVSYTAAPFSGWYVSTEIAARNFADVDRYNMLPAVARAMNLDTSRDRSLWKDRALVELSTAVLASYEKAGVRMLDHHTMSDYFARYVERESRANRSVAADWSWIVPPMSPATTPVYRQQYPNVELRPNFFRQDPPAFSGMAAADITRDAA
jgi:nitric-oxide synthase